MGKVAFLLLMIICSLTLVSCNSKTNNNTQNEESLKGIAEELGFKEYNDLKEIENRNVFITDNLKKIYESYLKTKDTSLLTGLEPIDVFRLYNNAKLDENYEVACSLINIPSDVDSETFLKEWKEDKVAKENEKNLLEGFIEKRSTVYQIMVDDTTSFIVFKGEDDRYRMEWVNPGIWKLGWLARQ